MSLPIRSSRTAAFKPGLSLFAALAAAWVFVLISLGAFTTSIGAGMAFPDWPLSNGSLNPHGWLDDLAMFAEHSHRLSAGVMTTLTIILAVWLWLQEARPWLRRLGIFAVGLVLAQAVVGGLRVLLDHIALPSLQTSVGRLFAMLHACLAQMFVCTVIALALSCSRMWIEQTRPVSRAIRRAGIVLCVLLFVQLAIAAVMRHSFAGLAIPTFPWASPSGSLLPPEWNFRVAIHFAHRVMAAVITIAVVWFAIAIWIDNEASPALRAGATALVALLIFQVVLGAEIILTFRAATVTTGHVLIGACTLATAFWLTWLAHRDPIEAAASAP